MGEGGSTACSWRILSILRNPTFMIAKCDERLAANFRLLRPFGSFRSMESGATSDSAQELKNRLCTSLCDGKPCRGVELMAAHPQDLTQRSSSVPTKLLHPRRNCAAVCSAAAGAPHDTIEAAATGGKVAAAAVPCAAPPTFLNSTELSGSDKL